MSATHCEWCLSFDGRVKKGRECCELRELAGMPKQARQEVYSKVRREDGADALAALTSAVAGEYQRRLEHRAAFGSFVRQKI
jgi:hypothetical protein